ncbi:MAG: histidyl-tRNA synthetase [Candidatus Paceibacteria bacterium]|jgi:histidyl-tRNA synthetase
MTKKETNSKTSNSFIVSQYYGFKKMSKFKVNDTDTEKSKSIKKNSEYLDKVLRPVEEQLALFRTCSELEDKRTEYPALVYQEDSPKGDHKKPRLKTGDKNISLHIIGTPKSIAEALLIKTALSILEEEGIKDVSLEINSVGGKESLAQFTKELNAYYRKNMNSMSQTCKQLFKEGSHSLVSCGSKEVKKMSEEAPSSLDFLSEDDRKHFSEVIEFLESENIPYEVNKNVLGDPYYSSHTVFTIINKKDGKIVATGTRCNNISKKVMGRKEMPTTSLTLLLNNPKKASVPAFPERARHKFCFIQLGNDAKFSGLKVIETLRKAKIPVYQSLSRDRLSSQLEIAERNRVPYILLMGQKEAMDQTVVVRDTKTHSQIPVPIKTLVPYLRNILKGLDKAGK